MCIFGWWLGELLISKSMDWYVARVWCMVIIGDTFISGLTHHQIFCDGHWPQLVLSSLTVSNNIQQSWSKIISSASANLWIWHCCFLSSLVICPNMFNILLLTSLTWISGHLVSGHHRFYPLFPWALGVSLRRLDSLHNTVINPSDLAG